MKNIIKKILQVLVLAVLVLPFSAFAINAFDFQAMQRNAANNGNMITFLPIPASGADGIIGLDGTSSLGKMLNFGNRISLDHATGNVNISTANIPESDITNLTSDLSGKVDTFETVNGHALSSNITITQSDVGLGNVDNTSDANKPVSTLQAASIATKFTIPTGTTAQYLRGDGVPTNFPAAVSSTYQALVSQSGTSAPSANAYVNDFTGTTFTWARTAVGTYTLTASNAVFTSNKTAVVMSNPPAFLNNYKYTLTSSTVITFQTATLSVLSLILTSGNADALLSNTMVYVIVYP